jgi:hypothetical protein
MTMRKTRWGHTFWLLILLLPSPTPLQGQLTGTNAAVLGTGENYTALARGVAALALNPAGLVMPGAPDWSVAIFPLKGHTTLEPVTLSDFTTYSGKNLPVEVREAWLQEILAAEGQTGEFGADITFGAVSLGRFGAQITTLFRGEAAFNEPAAELFFYGNAGRTGLPADFDLSGSRVTGFAVTTIGLSAALPFEDVYLTESLLEESLAVGATLKLSFGNAFIHGQDAGSLITSDPLELGLEFPIIQSDSSGIRAGSGLGIGLDFGAAWAGGPWSVGVAVKDIVNTFEWDVKNMFYRSGEAFFDTDTAQSSFDAQPGGDAPRALQETVTDLRFRPSITIGAAYQAAESLQLTTDIRKRFGEGIDVGPQLHLGLGFEFRPFSALSLQAGGAKITGGYQGGGGVELTLGPVKVAGAGMVQERDEGSRTVLMFSFIIQPQRTPSLFSRTQDRF